MKKDTHPVYHHNCAVKCACGHAFITGSVLPKISVEICSKCHPFYTGVKKLVDTEGRVEKFERIRTTAKKTKADRKAKLAAKTTVKKKKTVGKPKSLREILTDMK